jgi:hypothetical protein
MGTTALGVKVEKNEDNVEIRRSMGEVEGHSPMFAV